MSSQNMDETSESPKSSHFYALYSCSRNKGNESEANGSSSTECIMQLIATDLPDAANIELQKLILQKESRGLVYASQGIVMSVELGLSGEAGKKSACYYYCTSEVASGSDRGTDEGSEDSSSTQYILCFISDKEDSLDLFRVDLDDYSVDILKQLPLGSEVSTSLREKLETWHVVAIDYLTRCVKALQDNLKYLIYTALLDYKLVTSGGTGELQTDIQKFYNACSLSEILSQLKESRLRQETGSLSGSVDILVDASVGTGTDETQETVTVSMSAEMVKLDTSNCNKFCEEWGNALNRAEFQTPAKLKQVIEAFKLKFIQTMNTLKRLLREAENDFYALYRAFVFLRSSGNSEILMHYVTQEAAPDTASVLKVLKEFISETET